MQPINTIGFRVLHHSPKRTCSPRVLHHSPKRTCSPGYEPTQIPPPSSATTYLLSADLPVRNIVYELNLWCVAFCDWHFTLHNIFMAHLCYSMYQYFIFLAYCVSIHSLMDIWVVLTHWRLWIMLLWTLVHLSLRECVPRNGILGSRGNSMFTFLKNCQIASQEGCTIGRSHHVRNEDSVFFISSPRLVIIWLFGWSHSRVRISVWLWIAFPWRLIVLTIFSCTYRPFIWLEWRNVYYFLPIY